MTASDAVIPFFHARLAHRVGPACQSPAGCCVRRVATAWAGLRALRPVRRSEAGLSMHAFACPVTLPPGLNAPMPFAALALLLAHAHRFHGHAPCSCFLSEQDARPAAHKGQPALMPARCNRCGGLISSCSKLTDTIDLACVRYIFATILCALSGSIPKSHRSRSPLRYLFGLWHASPK